jgi:hypothetical protein
MVKNNNRKALLKDPLDMFMPTNAEETTEEITPHKVKKKSSQGRVRKIRSTFHLTEDIIEEARNAVVFLSGPPERLTLGSLTEMALEKEIARLKKKHNNGEDFPQRDSELRGGRPIGS